MVCTFFEGVNMAEVDEMWRTAEAQIDNAAGKHGIWMLPYQIQAAVGQCKNCRIKYRQY
jgi:hypothetical protein